MPRQYTDEQRKINREQMRLRRAADRTHDAYINRKAYCKRESIPHDLTSEFLKQLELNTPYCCVTGQFLAYNGPKQEDNRAELDRIDATKGYVMTNVRFISRRANRLKQDHSTDTLLALLADNLRISRAELDEALAPVISLRDTVESTEETVVYE